MQTEIQMCQLWTLHLRHQFNLGTSGCNMNGSPIIIIQFMENENLKQMN